MSNARPAGGFPIGSSGNKPVLYGSLGAILHLELLAPDDEARLESVNQLVWDWFGPELRWAWLSVLGVEPAERKHLDYVSCYAADLEHAPLDDRDAQIVANNVMGRARSDYLVSVKGGAERSEASPFSYSFWSEIPRAGAEQRLHAYSVLQITVPETWPTADFAERICTIASRLRLRWGAAGFTFSAWDESSETSDARYRHARRYPGYDLDEYVRLTGVFYERIRSINWLTFVGKSMQAELRLADRDLEGTRLVRVRNVGDNLLVQAGAAPERGDSNRLRVPDAYREADALLRPIRVRDGRGLTFTGPWSEDTITKWLQRFERLVG